MEFTCERIIINKTPIIIQKEHLDRYYYVREFVKNKKVLDIACGSGYGSEIIVNYGCKSYLGIDISNETVIEANKHYKSRKVKFLCGDGTDLHFVKNNMFDVIVSYETIEHIQNYKKFIKELKRVLNREGVLIISTPNKKYSSPNSIKPINPYHVIEFYPDEYKLLLNKYFSNVDLKGQDLQSKIKSIKKIIVNLFPKKFRQSIIPIKIRNSYNLNQVSKINDKPYNSRFLIAICKK